MSAEKRDIMIYQTLKALLGPILCRILGFQTKKYAPDCGPYLVVSNHNTDFDPIFVGCAFKQHMYFVASEHIFRWGWISSLLIWALHPIARVKGSTDATAALAIIRKLRSGKNVCLFAEGNRSYNGVTGPTFPATGKLIKTAKAGLVTYRIQGGYLASPRWSTSKRHGPITGELVHVYTAEELKAMTADEVNEAIQRDLYENAFERQKESPKAYTGKHLAQRLEYALYLCPKCGRIGTLHSHGDLFCCDCGLSVRYTKYGFFEGVNGETAPFETVYDWDCWQDTRMQVLAENATESAVFSDTEMELQRIDAEHNMETVAKGTLSISKTELILGDRHFTIEQISDMALIGAYRLTFTTNDGDYYQIRSDALRSGRKYATIFHLLKKMR